MSSNRSVTYIDIGLNSIAEYWSSIIVPSTQEYLLRPSPRTAFQTASGVWHLHDWVWHERNRGTNSRGADFENFRFHLISKCPDLGWLRDVADAGKHRGLGRVPEIAGAGPRFITLGSRLALALGTGARRKEIYSLVLSDGSIVDFEAVMRAAVEFWLMDLADHALPSPF